MAVVEKEVNVEGLLKWVQWFFANRGKIMTAVAILAGLAGYNLDDWVTKLGGTVPANDPGVVVPVEGNEATIKLLEEKVNKNTGDIEFLYKDLGVTKP